MPRGQYEKLASDERERRDEEVRRLAFVEGLDSHQIAERIGTLTDSRVGQILDTAGDRRRILYHLERTDHGVNAKEIANYLNIDINRTQYIVHNLLKRGLVTSDGKRTGGDVGDHNTWQNIRLKKRQHGKVAHQNGHLRSVAPNAPEFVRTRKPEQNEKVPEEEVIPTARRLFPDTMAAEAVLEEAQASVALDHDPKLETQSVPEAEPLRDADLLGIPDEELLAAHDIPRFPLLARLLSKDAKITEAARLLEGAGLDDLALQAMSHQDQFSPLEREYMKFVRSLKEKV